MIRYIPAAIAALLPLSAAAHDGMAVRDAYVRSANPASAAAFMVLENHRSVECRLGGVATDAAKHADLHTTRDEGGVMKMLPLADGITIAPGSEHALGRGADHVMMVGLAKPLKDGDTVVMTFDFGDCGAQTVEMPVKNTETPGATPDGHDMSDMDAHAAH